MIEEEATNLQGVGKGMKDGERVVKFPRNLDIQVRIAVMVMETEIGEDTTIIGIHALGTMTDRLLQIDQHRPRDREIFHDQSRQRLSVENLPNSGNPYSHQRPLVVVPLADQVVVGTVPTIVQSHDLVFHCRWILEHQSAIAAAQIMALEGVRRLQRQRNYRESHQSVK
jgi:hypothetical protein